MKKEEEEEEDFNPTLPSAHRSLVEQIPKTPPAKKESPYSLGDSDDDLEYTKSVLSVESGLTPGTPLTRDDKRYDACKLTPSQYLDDHLTCPRIPVLKRSL